MSDVNMFQSYVVIDVETPNMNNDRICSMGILVIENGVIIDKKYYLINPECNFDSKNVNIHGIDYSKVAKAPTFPDIWNRIQEIFEKSVIIAHNANFDLCVLKKTLQHYQISCKDISYCCTYVMAKNYLSEVANFKLNTLCDYYHIQLDHHHNALCDCMACYSVFQNLIRDFHLELSSCVFNYSFQGKDNYLNGVRSIKYSDETKALRTLQGILLGITADNVLNEHEVYLLKDWLESHQHLSGNYPFDKVCSALELALKDELLEQNELDSLLQLFKRFASPVEYDCKRDVDKTIEFIGKTICLSGEFESGSKGEIEAKLTELGAVCKKSVTQKTDYVLVGGIGNNAWICGNYGTKIKKALELQDRGFKIKILTEQEMRQIW